MEIDELIEAIKPYFFVDIKHQSQPIFEIQFGHRLPSDYIRFLSWATKGEGALGKVYFSLWAIDDILRLNSAYKIQAYLGSEIIAIGTDGGSIAFLLDYRSKDIPSFSSVNLGDLDPQEIKGLANSFSEALRKMLDGDIDGNLL